MIQALHQIRAVMRFRENGSGETDFGRSSLATVNSPTRITLENNGKIRPRPIGRTLSRGQVAEGTGPGSNLLHH